jgi:predicted phosphate transport protein (TIGR00153 family)
MVLARFLPRDERFFDYFKDAANNAAEVAQTLSDLLDHYSEVERKARRVRDLEQRGDEITHQIFDALNRTFVTPLDREDITDLAGRLDDFVDAIEQAVRRIWLYHMDEPTEHARLLARIISEQATLIAGTVPHLENRRQWDHMLQCTIDIQRLENEADDVLDQALAQQFDGVSDIQGLIKGIRWGEIYQDLEDATDCGEDIANTLEGIVVKNA